MQAWLLFIPACVFLLYGTGCGQVGTVCPRSGSTDGCASDHICTFARVPGMPMLGPNDTPPPPLNVCLRQCETSTDCGEGELCRVVFCSNQKSCQTGPLADPPPNLCQDGTGGAGGIGGTGGAAGVGGTGGTGGMPACDSTARAYIQTLDPGAGFIRTNFVTEDTTNLPEDWARYSISVDLTDPLLEGQLLQFGFSATASNFEPSGVFYDNVQVDPDMQYTSSFEDPPYVQTAPDALGDDPSPPWGPGWLVFGNVFTPDGTFIVGYGAFPAPNNTGAFSGIALGEGGVDQGDQVLVIISDYNNTAEQLAGNRVEANTFRERTITADDIGTTVTFSFDAKRGNINEGCPPPEEP